MKPIVGATAHPGGRVLVARVRPPHAPDSRTRAGRSPAPTALRNIRRDRPGRRGDPCGRPSSRAARRRLPDAGGDKPRPYGRSAPSAAADPAVGATLVVARLPAPQAPGRGRGQAPPLRPLRTIRRGRPGRRGDPCGRPSSRAARPLAPGRGRGQAPPLRPLRTIRRGRPGRRGDPCGRPSSRAARRRLPDAGGDKPRPYGRSATSAAADPGRRSDPCGRPSSRTARGGFPRRGRGQAPPLRALRNITPRPTRS